MLLEPLHQVIHGLHEPCGIYALILKLYIVCILLDPAGVGAAGFSIGFGEHCRHFKGYGQFRIFGIQLHGFNLVIFQIIDEFRVLLGLGRTLSSKEHVVKQEDDHHRAEQGQYHHPGIVASGSRTLVVLILLIVIQFQITVLKKLSAVSNEILASLIFGSAGKSYAELTIYILVNS